MTPADVIRVARSSGILISLTSSGTIKATGDESSIRHWLDLIRLHRQAIIGALRHELDRFRFDLFDKETTAGHLARERQRVNNMAWEFMQADGMSFNEAMQAAAAIAAICPPAPCEASYTNALTLWAELAAS